MNFWTRRKKIWYQLVVTMYMEQIIALSIQGDSKVRTVIGGSDKGFEWLARNLLIKVVSKTKRIFKNPGLFPCNLILLIKIVLIASLFSRCILDLFTFKNIVTCIKCYQCDSTQSIDCTDILINEDDNSFQPEECSSVFEARYCIKSFALQGNVFH